MVGIEQLPAVWRELIPEGMLLRSMQLEGLLAVASKRDALIVAKTGGGKSLAKPPIVLCVVPCISLGGHQADCANDYMRELYRVGLLVRPAYAHFVERSVEGGEEDDVADDVELLPNLRTNRGEPPMLLDFPRRSARRSEAARREAAEATAGAAPEPLRLDQLPTHAAEVHVAEDPL
ncbi:hypothetical protein T492DRAFT_876683 [Pavlovales sp. CCMP2436]|nr:hypothetical protein T492DRAFT_876683 [Pavlovales sp. CCMP2436]